MVILADVVAPKATGGIIHHLKSTLFTMSCDHLEKYMHCPLVESDCTWLLLGFIIAVPGVSGRTIGVWLTQAFEYRLSFLLLFVYARWGKSGLCSYFVDDTQVRIVASANQHDLVAELVACNCSLNAFTNLHHTYTSHLSIIEVPCGIC